MRKMRISLAMFAVMLLWIIPSQVKAAQNDVIIFSDVVKTAGESRSFKVSANVYSGEEALRQIKASANIILLEVSASMMSLSESPENNAKYFAGLHYKSIDEKGEFYTLHEGEYKPIIFVDGKFTVASFEKGGEKKATETVVGEKGEDAVIFTQVIYEKGECKTKLDRTIEELDSFINNLSELSPESQITMIYYGDDANIGENVTLDEDGVKKLKEEITGCVQYISENANSTQAVKLSKDRINELKVSFPDNINLIHFSDSAFIDEKGKESDLSIAMQEIKTLVTRVYMVGWFNEVGDSENNFMDIMGTINDENYTKFVNSEKLSKEFNSLVEDIVGKVPVEIKMKLNTCFKINESFIDELKQSDALIEENEKGEQIVTWKVNLPKTQNNSWIGELKIEAKDSFIGGNDIEVLDNESGIYWYGEKKKEIEISKVNVPVKKTGEIIEKEIFLGQMVPKEIDGAPPMQALVGTVSVSSGIENSGKLVHLWRTSSGKIIGVLDQLLKLKPDTNTDFSLISTFTPSSNGENSVGAPCVTTSIKSIYRIKVVSGSISVKAKLTAKQAEELKNTTNVFRIENHDGTLVQYRKINVQKEENDEQQGYIFQAEFKDLPFGVYTIKNVTNGEDGGEMVCVVGFKSNSDIVSTENPVNIIYVSLENSAKNTVVAEKKYVMEVEG